MAQNSKTNKTKVLQVRMTPEDYAYLQKAAFTMGTTASRLTRQMVQIAINSARQAEKNIGKKVEAHDNE